MSKIRIESDVEYTKDNQVEFPSSLLNIGDASAIGLFVSVLSQGEKDDITRNYFKEIGRITNLKVNKALASLEKNGYLRIEKNGQSYTYTFINKAQ